jgi:hypothetical protein
MTHPTKTLICLLAVLTIVRPVVTGAEVRFFSWDEPVADVLVLGGPKDPISINNGSLSRPITFSPSDDGMLEIYRMIPKPDGKSERSVLGRCRLPAEKRMIALLVPQSGKELPFQILAFSDPAVSESEKSAAFFFNLSQVPLAIQVGEYGKQPDRPEWPTPPRTLADRWTVPSLADRMPVTVAVAQNPKAMRKLFTRNLMLIPSHRAFVFFREEPLPDGPGRPGEGILYMILHEPVNAAGL